MVDFKKMRNEAGNPKPKYEYLFRCGKCDEEIWYLISLPHHMRTGHRKEKHPGIGTKCWGTLLLIETRLQK